MARPKPARRQARPETRGARLGLVAANRIMEARVGRDCAQSRREAMLTY